MINVFVVNMLNMGNNQASLKITIIFLMVIMGNSCHKNGEFDFLCVWWESCRESMHLVHPSFFYWVPGSHALTRRDWLTASPSDMEIEPHVS